MSHQLLKVTFFAWLVGAMPAAIAVEGGDQVSSVEPIASSIVNVVSKNGVCSGVILSQQVVITAAHCRDFLGELVSVALVGAGTTKPCDITDVTDYSYVPNAKPDLPFHVHVPDLLLVRLAKPLCSGRAAELDFSPLHVGDHMLGAGNGQGALLFGQTERLELQIMESGKAGDLVSPKDWQADSILSVGAQAYIFALATHKESTICDGDSGGAIYYEKNRSAYLRGVIGAVLPNKQLGVPACDYAYLQILTPLYPYKGWIEGKLEEWSSPVAQVPFEGARLGNDRN